MPEFKNNPEIVDALLSAIASIQFGADNVDEETEAKLGNIQDRVRVEKAYTDSDIGYVRQAADDFGVILATPLPEI